VPAYPDRVFKGHVTTLGSTIDPNSRRQLVRSEIDDPEHLLRAGMFASFVTRVGDPVRSLAVPANGFVREGDGTMNYERRPALQAADRKGWPEAGRLRPDIGRPSGDETVVTDGAVFFSNKLLLGDAG
jgi:cobalt-zinc-cadmium efflux system membrane fusion protein